MRNSSRLFISISIGFLLMLQGCSRDPVTGRDQLNFVSTEKEIKVGKEADLQIKAQYGIYRHPSIQTYVETIGQKIAKVSERKDIPYHFTVLDSPVINAFALPGGFVYVTRGILAEMNSEAELAFVLGHEISHVAAKHGAERMSQQQGLGFLNLGARILLGTNDLGLAGDLVNIGVELGLRGYGRNHEFEADLIGLKYVYWAKFHPVKASRFLYTLKRQETYQPNFLEHMLSTHPPTDERIDRAAQQVEELISSGNPNLKTYTVRHNTYLKKISGMFMGTPSGRGEMEGQTYKNYQYGCQFNIPKKWTVKASLGEEVIIFRPPYERIIGSLHINPLKPGTTLNKFINNEENPNKSEIISKSNLLSPSGKQVLYKERDKSLGQITAYRNYFVHNNIGFILVLKANQFDVVDYRKTIREITDSFSFISAKDMKKKGVSRLKIHTVTSGESLTSISKKYFSSDKEKDRIASFNDLPTDSPLKVGQLIKIPPPPTPEKKK
ncbi:MAG: M48 family metalloprotease [Candidatus Margulisbacteria bacterium]|nr:M48 family metalloprotease [Candidatus Margulisiibacteriota bacterium]